MKIKHLLSVILVIFIPLSISSQTRFDVKFTFDGVAREFILVKPSGVTPVGGYPVVFMFHGTGGDGEKFYNISGWKEKGETEKFITVFPTSLEYCVLNFPNNNPVKLTKWNNGDLQEVKCPNVAQNFKDDVKFIRKMVDTIKQTLNVNPKKIFASGFSNGCAMTNKLAMDAPDIFAAVAGSGGFLLPLDSVKPSRKIPIWNTIGNIDERLLAVLGRSSISMNNDSILVFVDSYLKRTLVCEGLTNSYTKSTTAISNTYTYKTPKSGEAANTVVFSLIKDLIHEYPNGVNYPLSAPTIFWEFFKQAVATDVQEIRLPDSAVNIFPNPSNTEMTLDLSAFTEGGKTNVTVYNTIGQSLFSINNQDSPTIKLYKKDIGDGLFIVKIKSDNKAVVKKIIFD